METEGVVQYRLLGSHPAASGRYHSYGFAGDTVQVATIVQDIVKQHQINLTKYKLDVRRLVPLGTERQEVQAAPANADKDLIPLNSFLRTYDRVVVNVSRRHYMDGVADAAQGGEKACDGRLQQVEGILQGHEETWSPQLMPTGPAKRERCEDGSEGDALAFRRITALSNKAFPLLPSLLRRNPTASSRIPTPTKGLCVVCELKCFKETVLPCCRFSVCAPCQELAKTMMMNENECAVCGALPELQKATNTNLSTPSAPIKRELNASAPTNAAAGLRQRGPCGSSQRSTSRGSSAGCAQSRPSRRATMATAFESDLTANMARVLSLLDVTDPLPTETKKTRRISVVLAQYTAL
ncbi:hypothetical protein DQ04_04531000 [Trypanosoma grayi]|uniref:hypothetical protein n=1 Tax=Trypanosoma grayi TaxID=71804 RepID=UPI0004F44DA5|nr:hypothetical protein DQ04_04531000 [Trypanosoma grayi]KEG09850.1 hypothetical protein DQ04_04531000 [Trypanosoma grayi]